MPSSGTLIETVESHQECDGTYLDVDDDKPCTFAGDVPVWLDSETRAAGWTCPNCATEHSLNFEDFTEIDPDYIAELREA